ncbi:glycoside hydrolase family 32 protein [Blastococcus sp. PRF04-17]|uniref:glycoside hydrolase family 32 protein n=1 Tax=Blastococcus sp. PRF04-17 TaxID=2933797 RepID=UPI001FF3ABF4|nr:glycoside hydrolase family 32 protein [Blastococcus sp. PRF04-17]UOY02889.1 glycoside hydrolase family 32 protein [Blastococcus sp. PRF04-17]
MSEPADPLRPRFHFTAPSGWINDPLGVTWRPDEARYEVFYQFNPEAPVWAPECRWGQASSPDLVHWADPRTALEPAAEETGCWSGAVVVDEDRPVIVYTSVLADAPGQGRVALAHGDAEWSRWTPDAAGPVLPAPAPEMGLAHVRDPFVWRAGEEWRMLLGAGSIDGRPSVLQFTSPDLRSWRPDGVLVTGDRDGPGGTVWECPQLFALDDAWVLIVSVWDEEPRDVACAVGDYDGSRFTPRAWQPLAGFPVYATTAFADAAGRRCALSWLQEGGPAGGTGPARSPCHGCWAGTATA